MNILRQHQKISLLTNRDIINLWLMSPSGLFKFSEWGVPMARNLFKNRTTLSLSLIFDKIVKDLGVEIAKDITEISYLSENDDSVSLEVKYKGDYIVGKDITYD